MNSELKSRPGPERKGGRVTAAALVAVALGGGAIIGTASTAQAATASTYNNGSAGYAGGVEWGQKRGLTFSGTWEGGSVSRVSMGSYFVGGQSTAITAYCIDWLTTSTDAATSASSISGAFAAVANVVIAENSGTPEADAAIAYAIHANGDPKFQNATDPVTRFFKDSNDFKPYRDQGNAWWAAAVAKAGPYKVQPQLSVTGQAGTVTGSLTSAAGNPVNLGSTTYALAGPVAFAGGAQSIGGGPADTNNITVTGNGTASVTQTVTDLPGTELTQYVGAGTQTKVAAAGRSQASGKSADMPVILDMQPVATSTAPTYLEAGQDLTDVLHVSTTDGKPTSWVSVDGTPVPAVFDTVWYYSPTKLAPTPEVPATAIEFTSGKVTATGVADFTVTGAKKTDKPGFYYPVASFTKAKQPAELQQYFKGDWKAGFNDPGEQSIVKYTPQVVTKASEIVDGKVRDVLTVTGNNPEAELTVTSNLVMTKENAVDGGTDKAPADAKVIGTVTTKVTGNGDFPTAWVDVPWDMIVSKWSAGENPRFYWQETIPATESTKPWQGKHQLPNETVPFDKPTITTQASPNGTVPVEMSDTYKVEGTIPNGKDVKVEADVALYKFDGATDGSAQPVCLSPIWTSEKTQITAVGTGTFPGSFTATSPGTYGFQETLTVTYPNEGGSKTVELGKGKCGEQSETVIAFPTGVTPTPEKPQLLINAGAVATSQGPNLPLLIAGGSAAAVLIVVTGFMIYRRRHAAAETASTQS